MVWSGTVEVLDLADHPKSKQCYARRHRAGRDDKRSRYVIVLKLRPVGSPLAAVRASVVSDLDGTGPRFPWGCSMYTVPGPLRFWCACGV